MINTTQPTELLPVQQISSLPDDVVSLLRALDSNVQTWRELRAYYSCAMMEVETKFKVLNEQFSLQYDRNPIEAIKTRIKEPRSLVEKMRRRGVPLNMAAIEANIHDVAGVRVICSFPQDIYTLADCLLRQDDITLIQKKDYIQNPKSNGYRALHLIVQVPIFLKEETRQMKVEVQLRTIAMDFWASLEHKLRYKKKIDASMEAELEKELLECSEAAAALDRQMQQIRDRLEGR